MTATDVATGLVLTERHEGVLTITINRPGSERRQPRGRGPAGSRPGCAGHRPDIVGGCAHRCGRDVQRGHGPEGVRQRTRPRSLPVVVSAGSPKPWCANR